jgi:hypothetical protein
VLRAFPEGVFMPRLFSILLVGFLAFTSAPASPAEGIDPTTTQFEGAGPYGQLLSDLHGMIISSPLYRKRVTGGKERQEFVFWIRDHVHVMKALKYWEKDIASFVEFFLENQTPEGMFFDYYYPIERDLNWRMNVFEKKYWKIISPEKIQMHRLPVEADVEYLVVEGVYAIYQSTGDLSFLKKWVPALEKGMQYAMNDPVRWSRKHRLVKRGYTLDTWDFQQLPVPMDQLGAHGYDSQDVIFNVDEESPMGIMHGDNSGMYAACRQLAEMHRALGNEDAAAIWDKEAELFRLRTNLLCWNGSFYMHFLVEDPMPPYLKMDQENTLSLSNTYDINRGLPTDEMAESIISTYLHLKEKTADESFAEWYGIYPGVEPDFQGYKPGEYVNGGVITIVAGELAKAAFQHGFESYGVDILNRIIQLVEKHDGKLPGTYRPDGTVDAGIPDNWGQAAIVSALIEGLAGVVDQGSRFSAVELSPRWLAAGVDETQVRVGYGASADRVQYSYKHDPEARSIEVHLTGSAGNITSRILLPDGATQPKVLINGKAAVSLIETVRNSNYAVAQAKGPHSVRIEY